MRNHLFKAIYRCVCKSDWPLLETDEGIFELRLGAIKRTQEKRDVQYRIVEATTDIRITQAMSDDFAVFLELENGGCIVHSQTFLCGDGQLDFEVYCYDEAEFAAAREEWYGIELPIWEIHPL